MFKLIIISHNNVKPSWNIGYLKYDSYGLEMLLPAYPADLGFSVSIMSQFLKTNSLKIISQCVSIDIDIETCRWFSGEPWFPVAFADVCWGPVLTYILEHSRSKNNFGSHIFWLYFDCRLSSRIWSGRSSLSLWRFFLNKLIRTFNFFLFIFWQNSQSK